MPLKPQWDWPETDEKRMTSWLVFDYQNLNVSAGYTTHTKVASHRPPFLFSCWLLQLVFILYVLESDWVINNGSLFGKASYFYFRFPDIFPVAWYLNFLKAMSIREKNDIVLNFNIFLYFHSMVDIFRELQYMSIMTYSASKLFYRQDLIW